MQPVKKLHPGIYALIIVFLIGVAATAVIVIHGNAEQQGVNQASQMPQNMPMSPADTTTSTTYKDGTYSATGSYLTPGGRESVDLTVTIKDGIIISTVLDSSGTSRDSREYQAVFAQSYKSQVEGKNADRVSLSRVAGSSLTSNGFNMALDQIKTDAKA